jgi:hypothetical protein
MLNLIKKHLKEYKASLAQYQLALSAFELIKKNDFKPFKTLVLENPSLLIKPFDYANTNQTLLEYSLDNKTSIKFSSFILDNLDTLLYKNQEIREEFFNFTHNNKNYGALLMAIDSDNLFHQLIKLGAKLNHFDELYEFCKNNDLSDLNGHIDFAFQDFVDGKEKVKHYPIKITQNVRKNVLLYEQVKEKDHLEKMLETIEPNMKKTKKVKI